MKLLFLLIPLFFNFIADDSGEATFVDNYYCMYKKRAKKLERYERRKSHVKKHEIDTIISMPTIFFNIKLDKHESWQPIDYSSKYASYKYFDFKHCFVDDFIIISKTGDTTYYRCAGSHKFDKRYKTYKKYYPLVGTNYEPHNLLETMYKPIIRDLIQIIVQEEPDFIMKLCETDAWFFIKNNHVIVYDNSDFKLQVYDDVISYLKYFFSQPLCSFRAKRWREFKRI